MLVTQLLRIVKAVKVHLRKLIYSIKKKQNSLSIFHYIESGGLGRLGQVAWESGVAGVHQGETVNSNQATSDIGGK